MPSSHVDSYDRAKGGADAQHDGAAGERRHTVWLVAIVIVAALCIVPRLGSQSLWIDEVFTILPALEAQRLSDLPARVRAHDTHPPLSHTVLYLTRDVLPQSELGWRLPSFLFIEAGLLLLYAAVARGWNRRVALTAFLCGQVSPYLMFYATEARGYALWFLGMSAAFYCMARWADSLRDGSPRATWAWALAWSVANAAALWTHLFHVFALVWQGVVVIALALGTTDRALRRRGAVTAATSWAVAMLALLPWILLLLAQPMPAAGVGWTRPPSLLALAYYPYAFVLGFSFGPDLRTLHADDLRAIIAGHALALGAAAVAVAVVAMAAISIARLTWRDPARRWETAALLVAPGIAVLGPFAYVFATSFPLTPRHLLFAWPAIPVLIALAAHENRSLRIPLAGVALLMLVSSANLLWNPEYAKDDERGAVHFAEAHSSAPAYIFGDVALLYARGSSTLVGQFKRESRSPKFDTRPHDVWLVENRDWQGRDDRARLDGALAVLGLRYAGATSDFHGVVLHHWRAEGDEAG